MLKKVIFFLFALAILLAPLLIFAEEPYPDEVLKLIPRAERSAVCEKQKGIIGYLNNKENWVVRIFTIEKQPLEIWLNYTRGIFWEYYPDKVYYFTADKGWLDAADLDPGFAQKLDHRIKFTGEEIDFLKSCFKKQK